MTDFEKILFEIIDNYRICRRSDNADDAVLPEKLTKKDLFNKILGKAIGNSLSKQQISSYTKKGLPSILLNRLRDERSFETVTSGVEKIMCSYFSDESLNNIFDEIASQLSESTAPGIKEAADEIRSAEGRKQKTAAVMKALDLTGKLIIKEPSENRLLQSYQPKRRESFVGRHDEFVDIYNSIAENGYAVLFGLPGMGKTALAEQYLAAYRNEYDIIIRTKFRHSIKKTVALLPVSDSSVKLPPERKRELLNKYGAKAIVLIDDVFPDSMNCDPFGFVNEIADYGCHFLFTTRMDLTGSQSTVPVKELTDKELISVIVGNVKGITDTDKELLNKNSKVIHSALSCNTAMAVRFAEEIALHPNDVNALINMLITGSPGLDKVSSYVRKVVVPERLDHALWTAVEFMCLFPLNFVLRGSFALEILGDAFADLKKAASLGFIFYSRETDSFSMYPPIYFSAVSQNKLKAKDFEEILTNVRQYAAMWVSCRDAGSVDVLYYITRNISGASALLTKTRGEIIVWLNRNGYAYLAKDIYENCKTKPPLPPELIVLFEDNEKRDAEHRRIRRSSEYCKNYFEILYNGRREEYEELVRNDPGKKLRNDAACLSMLVNTMKTHIDEDKHELLEYAALMSKMIVSSYASQEAFMKMPDVYSDKDMIKYLRGQIGKGGICETDAFQTCKALGLNTEGTPSFFNSKKFMNKIYLDICYTLFAHDIFCNKNREALVIFKGFIYEYSFKVTEAVRTKWLTEFIYGYIDSGRDLSLIENDLNEHRSLLSKAPQYQSDYIISNICRMKYESIILMDQTDKGERTAADVCEIIYKEYYEKILLCITYNTTLSRDELIADSLVFFSCFVGIWNQLLKFVEDTDEKIKAEEILSAAEKMISEVRQKSWKLWFGNEEIFKRICELLEELYKLFEMLRYKLFLRTTTCE